VCFQKNSHNRLWPDWLRRGHGCATLDAVLDGLIHRVVVHGLRIHSADFTAYGYSTDVTLLANCGACRQPYAITLGLTPHDPSGTRRVTLPESGLYRFLPYIAAMPTRVTPKVRPTATLAGYATRLVYVAWITAGSNQTPSSPAGNPRCCRGFHCRIHRHSARRQPALRTARPPFAPRSSAGTPVPP